MANSNKKSEVLFGLLAFILLVSCSSDQASNKPIQTGEKSKSDLPEYIQSLENVAVYSANEEPEMDISFRRVQSYGDTENIYFRAMGEFEVGPDGKVFIADGAVGSKTIHVYRPDGNYLSSIGRPGKGPAEFQGINYLKVNSNRLYVYDTQLLRMSVFSTDSLNLIRTILIDPSRWRFEEPKSMHYQGYHFLNDSTFLVGFDDGRKIHDEKQLYTYYHQVDSDWQNLSNEILRQKLPKKVEANYSEGIRITHTFPFFPKSLLTVSSNGNIYSAWSEYFLIKKYDSNGVYERSFYYPNIKIRVTRKDLFANNTFVEAVTDQVDLPEYWPVIKSMQFDDEGRLWISTFTEDPEVMQWRILEPTGELIAKFKWKGSRHDAYNDSGYIKIIKNGFFYTREKGDKSGIQQIVKYKINFNAR